MSKQKRGIQYIKNDEPAFLKRMKQQAGYKEGDNVETKRQELETNSDDGSDKEDEKPQVSYCVVIVIFTQCFFDLMLGAYGCFRTWLFQVVVLSSGDLTEDQAKHAEREAATKPREATNEKIVFKKPKSDKVEDSETEKKPKKKFSSKKVKNSSLLSFNEDEEDG